MEGSPLPPDATAAAAKEAIEEFCFCQAMGWTGNQLDSEPRGRVELWMAMWRTQVRLAERNRPPE